MAISTPTVIELKLLVEVPSTIEDATLELAISTAQLIVQEDLAAAGLSDARLSRIWLYLAAHFLLMTTERGGITSSRTGDQSQETYGGAKVLGDGLSFTRFGHQAIALDTSGTLAKMAGLDTSKDAQFRVL